MIHIRGVTCTCHVTESSWQTEVCEHGEALVRPFGVIKGQCHYSWYYHAVAPSHRRLKKKKKNWLLPIYIKDTTARSGKKITSVAYLREDKLIRVDCDVADDLRAPTTPTYWRMLALSRDIFFPNTVILTQYTDPMPKISLIAAHYFCFGQWSMVAIGICRSCFSLFIGRVQTIIPAML